MLCVPIEVLEELVHGHSEGDVLQEVGGAAVVGAA